MNDIVMIMLSIVVVLYSTFIIISNINALKKLTKENENLKNVIQISSKKKVIDYEKDFTFLNELINNNLNYFVNTLLTPIITKQDKGFLKDSDMENYVVELTYNIKNQISESYIHELEFYVSDIDMYISNKLYTLLIPYTIELNVNKLT